jgi:hypothetical protein
LTHAIPSPVTANRLRDTMSAGAPTAKPAAGRKKYIAARDAVAVATTPGPSPPYQAAIRIAGKNWR